ncbi:MAG: succinyldiaminopimelate transaminase [Magnetococcales bacterium]|nr:succinyldiaminopimelate transaminase [Magnetococcales bacterium]
MNPDLDTLNPYPFEKLALLFKDIQPPASVSPINISIGEPKHAVPALVKQAMTEAMDLIGKYPGTRGELPLRQAISGWLERRFALGNGSVDPERHVLTANGTREALFSIAPAVIDRYVKKPAVLMPNPFYQIYEGAALMSGAEPIPVDAVAENGFIPDFESLPEEVLNRTQLAYICTPSNPTGSTYTMDRLKKALDLAERYNFVLTSDECYSEIWYDTPPAGLLQAAKESGRDNFENCLVFHSLSKRSNMPGARTGFVAGDAHIIERYFRLRTYTGGATPPFIQQAAITAWNDEQHVAENRAAYAEKLDDAVRILEPVLPVVRPDAGFYLWLRVPDGGAAFAQKLLRNYNVTVLPGEFLGRPSRFGPNGQPGNGQTNPGAPFIRIALVATPEQNREAMQRIAMCASSSCSV